MKRATAVLMALMLLCLLAAPLTSLAGPISPSALLSLTHNAPRTGIMLPKEFSPTVQTYLLTVADWVSRITFTCVPADPAAAIYVNGQPVAAGSPSQIIQMTNDPQVVTITVVASGGAESTEYSVFLQRRPGYDRISVGYIMEAKPDAAENIWTLKLDLVSVKYQEGTSLTTFTNNDTNLDTFDTTANCICYSGTMASPVREQAPFGFFKYSADTSGGTLYRFVIIGNRVHMILPYNSD